MNSSKEFVPSSADPISDLAALQACSLFVFGLQVAIRPVLRHTCVTQHSETIVPFHMSSLTEWTANEGSHHLTYSFTHSSMQSSALEAFDRRVMASGQLPFEICLSGCGEMANRD
ncbi:hypothetical protein KP509_24G028200 [Ceratopteris richardii]|uniref:Uncharacterized protein n=1 Tax=Ceratopteris richardii TaxID=49495 RepID=A0A8T2RWB9_CERRI|nr:hypothetical protein KP509_24G028200 [Ceratopteris richardii]